MTAVAALAPAAGAQTLSNDASLRSLSLESDLGQTRMFPAFDPAVERYDVAVPSGETEVTVKVATNDSGATVEVRVSKESGAIDEVDADAITEDYTLELRTDRYTGLSIDVTAEDGTEKQYYLSIEVASIEEGGWRVYNDVPMDRLVDGPQLPSHYIRGLWASDSRVFTTAWRHETIDEKFYLSQKLYAFDAVDSSRLPDEEFVLSGNPDAGIWSDGTDLWALDSDGTLRAYSLSDGSETTEWRVDFTPAYGTREVHEPRGIWSDGDTLWVTGKDDADNAKAFAFALPKGCNNCRRSSLDFELSGVNDNPWGITGNDDTWWVTEVGDGGFTADTRTIYAYNRSDGTRNAAKDIDLLELHILNNQQLYYGLAATDTIMYVAEYITGRVYSFNLSAVDRVSPALNSSDTTLSSLSLSGLSSEDGSSAPISYTPELPSIQSVFTASVEPDITSVTVTATPNHSLASVVVSLGSDDDGTFDLVDGTNTIDVDVTAQDGTTKKYTVGIHRRAKSTDATLDMLELSRVTLAPSFMSATEAYTASVANGVEFTAVTATPNDSAASHVVQLGGVDDDVLDGVDDDDGVVDLAVGDNEISVVVTAEDGQTTKTYTVTVTRAEPPPNTDATLDMLELSRVTLAPSFMSATEAYTASVANGVEFTAVTATPNDSAASHVVQLDGVDDDDGVVDLAVGDNEISVVVTAEDGQTTKTYTVTVTRAEPPPNTDATLDMLELSRVTLAPSFMSATEAYTASVANGVEFTAVTATPNDSAASHVVQLGGVDDDVLDGVDDDDGVVDLAVGDNEISVVVTAEDGQTTKTYTVTVTRAAVRRPPGNSGNTGNTGNTGGGSSTPIGGSNSGSNTESSNTDDESETTQDDSDTSTTFEDAGDAGTDIETAINALHPLGVFTGTECRANHLCPNDPLPRWIAAVWLVRLIDGDDPAEVTETRFEDVIASTMWEEAVWYAPHVERLADLEITVGCREDPLEFCPDVNLTRSQVASWVVRSFGLDSAESQGFEDVSGGPHEANINAIVAAGVMEGCSTSPKNFCIDGTVTKGEMALYVYRARNVDS